MNFKINTRKKLCLNDILVMNIGYLNKIFEFLLQQIV